MAQEMVTKRREERVGSDIKMGGKMCPCVRAKL
jgi:hypothetical protein